MITPTLSPDGQAVAYVDADGTVTVTEVATATVRTLHPLPPGAVHALQWAPDNEHLLLITETNGRERFTPHALRVADRKLLPLAPANTLQVRGLWTSPTHPHAMVTAIRRQGDPTLHPWYLPLDRTTPARQLAHCTPGTRDWAFDPQLTCRASLLGLPDGTLRLLTTADGHDWRPLLDLPLADAPDTRLLGIHPTSGEILLLTAYDADAVRLAAVDPRTAHPRTLLAAPPPYDITTAWLAPDGTPRAALHHAARRHHTCADPAYARDLARAATHIPGDLELLGHDTADTRWLLAAHDPARPPRHHVYDREQGTAVALPPEPQHPDSEPPFTTALTLTTSDGHPLTAYLTLPPNTVISPPLILRVHGGPWARDRWRHDPEAAWLAAAGMAVLRVNYRGSSGYGRAFRDLGDGEWGARMQQDLYDAVDAVAGRGLCDPERVAAYGGSYGGYASLLALTDPRFRCAVAVNPLVDLASSDWADGPYWRRMRALWDKQIGWSRLPEGELRRRSPVHRVADMRGPALVVRGAHDPRVDAAGIEAFVRDRRAAGGEVEELILPDDGHAVRSSEGQDALRRALSAFLTRHLDLPTPATPAPPPGCSEPWPPIPRPRTAS
ncbi:prolyl oligopeptidase family serine peptidase [Streptomyces sp. NRRL F-525]|uniref:prolyl oligopeptidase family serine peptidase n=1 Tax=Streptomyces sp. NRRL F-525 TaxID=1463861 RepID=UPI0005241BA8|nr:prolyl oligopeptidase family serine peptidase [Streptomyces sp. NRRL F-525]